MLLFKHPYNPLKGIIPPFEGGEGDVRFDDLLNNICSNFELLAF